MGARLEGQTAVVTGAGSGIGRAIATLFATEGARVCVVDINERGARETVEAIECKCGEALTVTADISRAEDVDKMVDLVLSRYGKLHILVNNAGIVEPGAADETTDEGWQRNINVNLTGVFLCCRRALREMVKQGGGVIVNISSLAALHSIPRRAAYSAAKAGVYALTRSIALDYAAKNIRANAIFPGAVFTPLTQQRFSDPAIRQTFLARIPLGRLAEPIDIARAALFLASSESGYITGQALIVDGGWSIP